MKQVFILSILVFIQTMMFAQKPAPIIFIVDASGSMWGQIEGETKMQIAKGALTDLVDNMTSEQPIGLVAYGHRQKSDCSDVEYLISNQADDRSVFKQMLASLQPLGKTPLAYSAKLIIDDLKKNNKKATIILLTDGIETCEGDLCELIKESKAEGIEFKMHIVGFDLKPEEKANLQCAATEGDGEYLDASNAKELDDVLNQTTNERVDDPTSNCFIAATKNGRLIDGYLKIVDKSTGKELKRKHRTYSDTLDFFITPGQYTITVNVLGQDSRSLSHISKIIEIKDVSTPTHVAFAFDAGTIFIDIQNNGEPWDAVVKIIEAESNKVVTSGRSYKKGCTFDLNEGSYNIQAEPMVIKGANTKEMRSFSIQANQQNTVRINYISGTAWIGSRYQDAIIDATVSIVSLEDRKPVASARTYDKDAREFILLPGKYLAKLIAVKDPIRGAKKEVEFEVIAGEAIRKVVNF